jgi:hypothetical protein
MQGGSITGDRKRAGENWFDFPSQVSIDLQTKLVLTVEFLGNKVSFFSESHTDWLSGLHTDKLQSIYLLIHAHRVKHLWENFGSYLRLVVYFICYCNYGETTTILCFESL